MQQVTIINFTRSRWFDGTLFDISRYSTRRYETGDLIDLMILRHRRYRECNQLQDTRGRLHRRTLDLCARV